MRIVGVLAALMAVAVFVLALRAKRRSRMPTKFRPDDGSDTVSFDLAPLAASDPDERAWTARYRADARVAEFEIRLRIAEPAAGSPFAAGSAVFRRVPGTDGAALLRDLARDPSLSDVPSAGPTTDELRCDVGFMGSHLTRGPGPDVVAGSFTSNPRGNWIVGKIFFADGDGEVFLAVSPASGRGEFLAKDPEFSEPVLREFGRLF